MPNYWQNWTYKDVANFLKHHSFRRFRTEGSHHHFLGIVDGKQRLVQVPFHVMAQSELSQKPFLMVLLGNLGFRPSIG